MIDVVDGVYVLVKEGIYCVNLRAFGFLLVGNVTESCGTIRSHTYWWLGF